MGARQLFIGLITRADDYGNQRASASLLKGAIFPFDDDVTVADVEQWKKGLEVHNITIYEVDDHHYIRLNGWFKHQRIDTPSKKGHWPLPPPEALPEGSVRTWGGLPEGSRRKDAAPEPEKGLPPADSQSSESTPGTLREGSRLEQGSRSMDQGARTREQGGAGGDARKFVDFSNGRTTIASGQPLTDKQRRLDALRRQIDDESEQP